MIKNLVFKLVRYRVRKYLPMVNSKYYSKLFTYTYKFFVYLKPSQLWIIVLALINKTEFKNLVSIPSMLMLFSTLFSDDLSPSNDLKVKKNLLIAKLEVNGFIKAENNWEKFFFILIVLALIKRFTVANFKLMWIPLFFKDNSFNLLRLKIPWIWS